MDWDFVVHEIEIFKRSQRRADMIVGERYALGLHDILWKKRCVIDGDGNQREVRNLPNNRVVDNQFFKAVTQKSNYLLGRPFSFKSDDPDYARALRRLFGNSFRRLLKRIGEDCLTCGTGFVFLGFEDGKLAAKRLPPWEVIPEWSDAEHTKLDCVIRVYNVLECRKNKIAERVREFVEVYSKNGIFYFELDGGRLVPRAPFHQNYFTVQCRGASRDFNWDQIPVVAFRANSREIPLIRRVKSLQDSLNSLESNFRNVMEEEVRNSVMVLVNYDGEDLSSFRHNLAEFGVVPVRTVDGGAGDVKTLRIEVSAENYLAVLRVFKKAIIENAAAFDAADDRLFGNPNELNLRSMYSDIDLDANNMESEFRDSFERVLHFADCFFKLAGVGDFSSCHVDVIFDRDVLINESEVIENCVRSKGLISDQTIVAMHPWIDDPDGELCRMKT